MNLIRLVCLEGAQLLLSAKRATLGHSSAVRRPKQPKRVGDNWSFANSLRQDRIFRNFLIREDAESKQSITASTQDQCWPAPGTAVVP